MERLWLRLGDAGEYEDFGQDMAAVAETCAMAGVRSIRRLIRTDKANAPHRLDRAAVNEYRGVAADGFEGDNYISLYWGDADANMTRGLSVSEMQEFADGLQPTE